MAALTAPNNNYGVKVTPLEMQRADAPTVQLYHGASIVANNNVIGRVTSFQAAGAYTREGAHIYEVSNQTWGVPVDYVPGRATGFNVTLARIEVWQQELEIALGFGSVFENLTDQTRPFELQEYIFRGQEVYRTWKYLGCWLTSRTNNAMEAEGDGIIRVDAEINYVSRIRTQ